MTNTDAVLNVEKDLKGLVAEILEAEPDIVEPDAHFVKDLGMDSMMALEILAGIEKKYRIAVPEEMLPQFTSLNETTKLVKGLLANQ